MGFVVLFSIVTGLFRRQCLWLIDFFLMKWTVFKSTFIVSNNKVVFDFPICSLSSLLWQINSPHLIISYKIVKLVMSVRALFIVIILHDHLLNLYFFDTGLVCNKQEYEKHRQSKSKIAKLFKRSVFLLLSSVRDNISN